MFYVWKSQSIFTHAIVDLHMPKEHESFWIYFVIVQSYCMSIHSIRQFCRQLTIGCCFNSLSYIQCYIFSRIRSLFNWTFVRHVGKNTKVVLGHDTHVFIRIFSWEYVAYIQVVNLQILSPGKAVDGFHKSNVLYLSISNIN